MAPPDKCGRCNGWSVSVILAFLGLCALCASNAASALDLEGTYWDRVAHEYHLDPQLLYAVALAESPVRRGRHTASPWPWTINTPAGPRYLTSRNEAERVLVDALSRWPATRIDVGLMQVSAGWHGDKVSRLSDLLDPATNMRVAASVLADALGSAPGDIELAIGHYHSHNPHRARIYGRRVIRLYAHLGAPSHTAMSTEDTYARQPAVHYAVYDDTGPTPARRTH